MNDVFGEKRRNLEERRRLSKWGSGEPRRGMYRQMAEEPTADGDRCTIFSLGRDSRSLSSCDDGGSGLKWPMASSRGG